MDKLHTLVLSNLPLPISSIKHVHKFKKLPALCNLYVVHEEACCFVSSVNCIADIPSKDVFATCTDIISSEVILALDYLYTITGTLLNALSLILNISAAKRVMKVLLVSLNVSDGLMAVYLVIIIVSHHIHQGEVAFTIVDWKESIACKFTGALMISSVTSSNIVTMLLALDRFVCILLRPFEI